MPDPEDVESCEEYEANKAWLKNREFKWIGQRGSPCPAELYGPNVFQRTSFSFKLDNGRRA